VFHSTFHEAFHTGKKTQKAQIYKNQILGEKMKFLTTKDANFTEEFATLAKRGEMDMDAVIPAVSKILSEIKQNGLVAVKEHVKRFDGWDGSDLLVKQEEMKKAFETLTPELKEALVVAFERIKAFHEKQLEKSWLSFGECGEILGQKVTPVDRAGVYVPGGKAAYPSSLLMNVAPALVAGVKEVVVCTPAVGGKVNSLLLAAMHLCGVKEAYKVGGASAVGLMASGAAACEECGVKHAVKKVDVVTGPGNIFVATAKKLVFGEVSIDMVAGPSEVGIIADASANARVVAADFLSQAEHDEIASSFLLTPNLAFAREVEREIYAVLEGLERKEIAQKSVDGRAAIIVCESLSECVELANELAVEHLEVATDNAFELLPRIKHAGAIFLGHYTPEAFGDYLAGPNHTLPTGSTAKFFSPLGVEHFMKKSSVISLNAEFLSKFGKHCAALAKAEGLTGHALSVEIRKK